MYYFTSDYTEGCTPEILEALAATNFEQTGGYGIDPYCETAALLIKKECGRRDIVVHFMTGGIYSGSDKHNIALSVKSVVYCFHSPILAQK